MPTTTSPLTTPRSGFVQLLLWNVHRYGRLMRPKPLQKPISASNAFHNNAMGYDAVILSGTGEPIAPEIGRPGRLDFANPAMKRCK
jgi:hypothetical protein